jgi:hypothetical protein
MSKAFMWVFFINHNLLQVFMFGNGPPISFDLRNRGFDFELWLHNKGHVGHINDILALPLKVFAINGCMCIVRLGPHNVIPCVHYLI